MALTKKEQAWCTEYAKKLGLPEDQWSFCGEVDDGVHQVIFIVEKGEARSLGFLPVLTMKLRKFWEFDADDTEETGWWAFLENVPGHCSLQTEAGVKSPEEAIDALCRKLHDRVDQRLTEAARLEEGLGKPC